MKVLLVSPVFHGYWAAIAGALRACGHEVVVHCYDTGSRVDRLCNAAAHRVGFLAPRAAARATEAAIAVLRRTMPDGILVVKGDRLGAAWWDAVARAGARTAVWLYDELARMAYTTDTLRTVERVFSYSPHDVAGLRREAVAAAVLPDGFDDLTAYTPHPSPAVTFIGARYAPRERALQALQARGVSVEAYGRDWSRHPWDILRTRHWRSAGVPARRDIPRADYYGVMAGSLATLNIHGDGHDGLSMRTFEAPGVGGLQLIDRPDVAQFYDVGREVLVYRSDDELVEHVQHARREPAWAQAVRDAGRRRTLAEHTLTHRMREVTAAWV